MIFVNELAAAAVFEGLGVEQIEWSGARSGEMPGPRRLYPTHRPDRGRTNLGNVHFHA